MKPADPSSTPPEQPFAGLHETHSGVVILLGDRVYKTKKPIRTEFLDFRTRAARVAVCEREVELNRRLAPDVYLGVAELGNPDGGVGEPMVVMRRMPEQARLSILARDRSTVCAAAVDSIARIVADFHRVAARGPEIDRAGTVDAVRRRWHDNLRETRKLDQRVIDAGRLDAITRAVDHYLDGRSALFGQRITDGCIVDGHADLLSDDIFCLDDGPRILDCLEFDDRLRYIDRIDDIACLAMDLEFQGRPDLAERLLLGYTDRAAETAPDSLVHHYIAYRAFMRAKVDCVRYLQGRAASADDALKHTALAEEHLEQARCRLAVVGGLPATGKSTLAARLAELVGAELISSDHLRRHLFADDRASTPAPDYRSGRYSADSTDLVYASMLERAHRFLAQGRSVVLDASWTHDDYRARAAETAAETCSDLVQLRCTAPAELTERRLLERAAARRDSDSEATPAVAVAMAHDADPWPEAALIDTSGPLDDSLAAATAEWSRQPH
ncbi:AAA family ATPase [Rhodococcus sp. OK519]|uniref:bifunctional aminoglycoside phosphotransferase/ATP-binding protein n=1 Tax=Rhodococcus sp. OK519 TaxID=2135729 RepID=UPI0021591898